MRRVKPVLILTAIVLVIALLAGVMLAREFGRDLYEHAFRAGTVTELAERLVAENSRSGRASGDLTGGAFTWGPESKTRSWTYYTGLMMDGLLSLDEERYRAYVEAFYTDNILPDGTPVDHADGELDSIAAVNGVFPLLTADGSGENEAKFRAAIQYEYRSLEKQVTYRKAGGNYLHKQNGDGTPKGNWSEYSIGLEGAYMSKTFLYRCADAIDNKGLVLLKSGGEQVTSKELRNLAYKQLMWMLTGPMLDARTHLLYHGFNPRNGAVNGVFWSRSIGWAVLAVSENLEYVKDSRQRAELVKAVQVVLDGLLQCRDWDSGLWYNLPTRNADLPGNRLETSGSAMFAYALLKLAVSGEVSIPRPYAEAGIRAYNSIVDGFLAGGELENVYLSAGVSTHKADYLAGEYAANNANGVAPMLLATPYYREAVRRFWRPSDDG